MLTYSDLDDILSVDGNHTCADCAVGGMALAANGKKQRPLWASVNLGVVLSVQAAGVHRKLGVHVSKVLSLTMDEWLPSDINHMLTRGNTAVNADLEADLAKFPHISKPSMASAEAGTDGAGRDGDDMHTLEAFIRAKYVSKSFVRGGDGVMEEPTSGSGASDKVSTGKYMGASVEYTGMLRVEVLAASGLPSMDIGSASDPYVVVKLPPGQERRTKTVRNCNNPEWGESLMFNTGNLTVQSLEVEVWDEDLIKADDLIGLARFPLCQLMDAGDGDDGSRNADSTNCHGNGVRETVMKERTRMVTLPLERKRDNDGLMFKIFGCCAGSVGAKGDLGSVTLQLNFIPLNNE